MLDNTPLIAGIDLGTTNIKAIVFTPTGEVVAQAIASTPTHYPRPGWAYHEPEALWEQVLKLLRQLSQQIRNPKRIVSLAVASLGEAGVPLDAHNQPTYAAIAWHDQRTQPQTTWLRHHIGADRLFAIAGVALQPIFSLCKLLWLKENAPDSFRRTVRWLNLADYITFRLCGMMATDYATASRMLTMNLHLLAWDKPLLQDVGIGVELFPPLVASGEYLGKLKPEVAQQTGLSSDLRISAGGHDQLCGALSVGVTTPGTVMDSIGTSEALCIPMRRVLTDPAVGRQGYTQGAHVVKGLYYLNGGLYTAGSCVAWFQEMVGVDYATLIREAEQVLPTSLGSCFLPHFNFANAPNNDPMARGSFIGLASESSRGVMMRAILEGLAYEARSSLEPMMTYARMEKPPLIYALGGATRNHLLMQIKATIYNRPIVVVDVVDAVSLGGAMLGGLGAGIYSDMSNAQATVSLSRTVITPIESQVAIYQHYYQHVYQQIYSTLKEVHHTIHRLQMGEGG